MRCFNSFIWKMKHGRKLFRGKMLSKFCIWELKDRKKFVDKIHHETGFENYLGSGKTVHVRIKLAKAVFYISQMYMSDIFVLCRNYDTDHGFKPGFSDFVVDFFKHPLIGLKLGFVRISFIFFRC